MMDDEIKTPKGGTDSRKRSWLDHDRDARRWRESVKSIWWGRDPAIRDC